MKPARSMGQLMDYIDEHKRVEEDQTQAKGKTKIFPPEKRNPWPEGYNHSQPSREFANQLSRANAQVANLVFKKPMYQILEKIKN